MRLVFLVTKRAKDEKRGDLMDDSKTFSKYESLAHENIELLCPGLETPEFPFNARHRVGFQLHLGHISHTIKPIFFVSLLLYYSN